ASKPINPGNRKIAVFTAFADTARYLYDQLAPWARATLGLESALVTGAGRNQTTLTSLRRDLASILSAFAPRAKERPAELAGEGDYASDVRAIEEGTAVVTRGGEEIAQLGPGDVIGEMGVLERDQRNATVVATSSMLLTTLTRWDIKRLEKSAPEVVSHLRELVEQRRDQA
ncbi:MAG TPA: cyclic nucleotide-binding domain-containing protein, partial [Baekduia sp.]|nr:cyclic nucleotide-binding domain-containing protein [Baekduia sp.]